MGKGSKWRKGHSPKAISEGIERIKKNEKLKQSIDLDTHKEVKKNKDGSNTYIY